MSQPTQQLKMLTVKSFYGKEMGIKRESCAFITRPPVNSISQMFMLLTPKHFNSFK